MLGEAEQLRCEGRLRKRLRAPSRRRRAISTASSEARPGERAVVANVDHMHLPDPAASDAASPVAASL